MAKHWRAVGVESGVIRWATIDAKWTANARAYLRGVECYAKAVIVQYEESMARRASIGGSR